MPSPEIRLIPPAVPQDFCPAGGMKGLAQALLDLMGQSILSIEQGGQSTFDLNAFINQMLNRMTALEARIDGCCTEGSERRRGNNLFSTVAGGDGTFTIPIYPVLPTGITQYWIYGMLEYGATVTPHAWYLLEGSKTEYEFKIVVNDMAFPEDFRFIWILET